MSTPDMRRDMGATIPSGATQRWFDGWRVVTGILAVLFMYGSVFLFAEADAEHRRTEECVRSDGWLCWDFSLLYEIPAVWALVLVACFGGATIAAGTWRRALVAAGLCLLLLPALLVWLLASPITFVTFIAFTIVTICLVPQRRTDNSAVPLSAAPVAPVQASFWRYYLVEMRPYLMFLSAVTGVAGMAFAPNTSDWDLLVLTTLFFLAYGFGQALTDCFQTDTDLLSAPYRPLAQGRLRQRDVLIVSLAGLVTGGSILAAYNPLNLALASAGVAGLATYTWFKRRWWGGPLYNAWIVADLCLIGYAGGLGSTGASLDWTPQLGAALFTVLFGYANFVLAGYFKDVSADRASGYNTMPVVFGWRPSSIASDTLAVLALVSCGLTLVLINAPELDAGLLLSAMFIAGAAAWTVLGQLRLHRVTIESQAHRAIAPVVHAYILMLSAIAAALQPEWAPLLVILYAGFFVALAQRPMKEQI